MQRQKGFTLIEMSIVLVIIGLIIGGILKGQEIIESSRQKNLIVAIDSIRSATNTFYDRFQALPGDFSAALTRVSTAATFLNGNGNGIVDPAKASVATMVSANVGTAAAAGVENAQFFVHLFGARLIGGVTPSAALQGAYGEGSALPAAAFPGTGFGLMYGTYTPATVTTDVRTGHWLRVNNAPAGGAGGLSPKTMYAIDVKTDDGLPEQGLFRSDDATANCGSANAYAATNESQTCAAFIAMAN